MKASILYSDLNGTIAAELTEQCNHSLQTYLERNFVDFDTERFYCRGCMIDWEEGEDTFALRFACFDKERRKYTLFVTERMPMRELAAFLKRVQIVLGVEMQEVFIDEPNQIYLSRK